MCGLRRQGCVKAGRHGDLHQLTSRIFMRSWAPLLPAANLSSRDGIRTGKSQFLDPRPSPKPSSLRGGVPVPVIFVLDNRAIEAPGSSFHCLFIEAYPAHSNRAWTDFR